MNNSGSKPAMNLQDSFLNHVRKENLGVIIYLINGFQIRGLVRGFDNFTVIIENEGKQQLVYKHAISCAICWACGSGGGISSGSPPPSLP